MMLLLAPAMRELCEGNITSEQFEIIKTHLEKVSTEEFQNDIQLAPIWVRKTLQNA